MGAAPVADAATSRGAPSRAASAGKKPKKKAASACTLLTVAEITQALGVAPTEPPTNSSATDCYYVAPSYPNFFNLSVRPLVSPALWKQEVQGGGATIAVAGLGDEAFRSPSNSTIMVRKGKRTLRIDEFVPGLSDAAIESLGKAATARL
jgi:hypothetical protein